jgi:kinesin family protein 13
MTASCGGGAAVPPTPTTPFDWRMAQEEVMLGEVANAPMREAIALLEAQYEADKRYALENQRKEFEKQFQHLRSFLSPATTPMAAGPPAVPRAGFGKLQDRGGGLYRAVAASPSVQSRLDSWGRQQDETFQQGLAKLRQDLVLVNGLVREANYLAQEIGAEASFGVTLQIPPHKLTPNRTPGAFLSEPAILVRRRRPQQRPQQQCYQEKALSSAATTQVNS